MRIKNFILSTLILILILSCATDYKRGPEGGINDKISPTVDYSSINDTALNMDKNSLIEIKFSEFIDINTARNSVNISPRSVSKKAKIFWYDKSAEIKFNNLDDNQTVVITISPSLKDTQGNALANSYSLSFSTGEKIDKKSVTGMISGAINKNEITVLNYSKIKVNLYSISNDSINFNKTEPEYSVGLSKDYKYDLKNLSSGSYKLIAFNDVNNDSKPQFETEMIGFSADDVNLNNKDSLNYEMTLGFNDTESPFIKSTLLSRNDILKIEFSEDIKNQPVIIDSLYLNNFPVQHTEYKAGEEKKIIYAKAGNFKIGDRIKIKLTDISDEFGNMVKPNFRSKTHTVTDTVPKTAFTVSGKFPSKIAIDQELFITTSYFDNDSLAYQMLNLKDSMSINLTKGITLEPFRFRIAMKENDVIPDNYEFRIVKADSVVFKAKLTVGEPLGTGQISGTISGIKTNDFVLICKNITGGSKSEKLKGKDYKLDLVPGKYLCALMADTNSDGVLNIDYKKKIIEKAVFFKDTVLVRKNWETADVNFEFK